MERVWGQVSRWSMYVRERERERFCCTEQICRAKVKVTAGLLPARGRGNLNQQLQHKRAHTISSLGVKKKKPKRLPLCWCEQAIYENICRFYACKRYFAGPQIRLYCWFSFFSSFVRRLSRRIFTMIFDVIISI